MVRSESAIHLHISKTSSLCLKQSHLRRYIAIRKGFGYTLAMGSMDNWLFSLCHVAKDEMQEITLSRGDHFTVRHKVALVCDGKLKVLAKAHKETLLLNQLSTGDLVGVSNLFLEAEPPTTMVATTKSTLVLVEKDLIAFRLREEPKAMEAYARFCNEKLQFLLGRLYALSSPGARWRLCQFIQSHQVEGIITLSNKQALSKALGLSRATLFRELAVLEEREVLVRKTPKTYRVNTTKLASEMEETS